MNDFKTNFINNIVKYNMPNSLRREDASSSLLSPKYRSLLIVANSLLNSFTSFENIGLFNKPFGSKVTISKSFLESIKDSISLYSSALLETSLDKIHGYIKLTNYYSKALKRFLGTELEIKNVLSELNKTSLRYLDIFRDSDEDNTTAYTIGNYITLPYILENTRLYSGQSAISTYSYENITFTNIDSIINLPLESPLLVRYYSVTNDPINVITIQCSIDRIKTNLVYINTFGDIVSIKAKFLLGTTVVAERSQDSRECIFNFDEIEIDTVVFNIEIANYNPKEQASIEIADINIFTNLKFNRSGVYQSKKVPLSNYLDIDFIRINAINNNADKAVDFRPYASITFSDDKDNLDFFKVDKVTGTTFPLFKFTNTIEVLSDSITVNDDNLVECIALKRDGSGNLVSVKLYKKELESLDVRYENAKLLIGTPEAYGTSPTHRSDTNNIYENWTKIDNFYRTMLVNNESNITVDIGYNIIQINNQELTGIINIPTGISVIDVHQSLFDPTLSNPALARKDSSSNSLLEYSEINSALNTNDYIYTDRLYPNNFIYKLAGLPEYDTNGEAKVHQNITVPNIKGLEVVSLSTPVLPYTVKVHSSDQARDYTLHLSDTPPSPGMFTVSPNAGLVKVYAFDTNESGVPVEEDNILIDYTAADNSIKPCGFLFNREAYYIDFKAITNMLATEERFDNTFFSVSYDKKLTGGILSLLFPYIEYKNIDEREVGIHHMRFMYNTYKDNSVYVASKFTLSTENSYITPVLSNLFIYGVSL